MVIFGIEIENWKIRAFSYDGYLADKVENVSQSGKKETVIKKEEFKYILELQNLEKIEKVNIMKYLESRKYPGKMTINIQECSIFSHEYREPNAEEVEFDYDFEEIKPKPINKSFEIKIPLKEVIYP